MFYSNFRIRIMNYLSSPKKYIVNVLVRVGMVQTIMDVEVTARNKPQAYRIAKERANAQIEVSIKGSKSLGRINKFF